MATGDVDKSNTSLSILSLVEGGLPVTDSNLWELEVAYREFYM